MSKLITREQLQAFADVGAVGSPNFTLIGEGFTDLSESKNAKEYTRQYVHEKAERSDVVGYAPSISYSFDMYEDDPVCEKIARITDEEKTGDEAHVDVVVVHLWDEVSAGVCVAYKRTYAVIPDSKGSGTDALIYTGTLKAVGEKVAGKFTLATKSFVADTSTLGTLVIEVGAGTDATHTKVTDCIGEGSGTLKYKVGASVERPVYGASDSGYSALTLNTEISCAATNKIVVVESNGSTIVAASVVTKVKVGS